MRKGKAGRRHGVMRGAALLGAAAALPGGALAQDLLPARVLGNGRGSAPLPQGERIVSPPGRCLEVVFSDSTSIVLEPGADFTRQGTERDPATGRVVLRASTTRGRVRVSTSDRTEVVLATPGAETRVVGASALVQAGPGGTATLLSGSRVEVRGADGRAEVIRRPAFEVAFDRPGVQRQSAEALAQGVGAVAPVTQRAAQCRGPGGPVADDPVVQVAGDGGRSEVSFRQRYEGTRQRQGGGDGGGFTLAAGGFGGPATGGSGIGAPRANSTTSVSNTANDITPAGQEGNLQIVGLERIQPQGQARIRRFAPAAGGGAPGARVDTGVVSPPATALSAGQPTSGPLSAYFRNLLTEPLPIGLSPAGPQQTFYDAIGRTGIVTLQVDNVISDDFTNNDREFDRISVPRYYVGQSQPTIIRANAFSVQRFSGSAGTLQGIESPNGIGFFTESEWRALANDPGTVLFQSVAAGPDLVRLRRFDRASSDFANVVDSNGDPILFDARARDAFLGQQAGSTTGPVYVLRAELAPDSLLVHRTGSVFEIELQERQAGVVVSNRRRVNEAPPSNAPANDITIAPPLTEAGGRRGLVFALSGPTGLAMQVGGEPLPGLRYREEDPGFAAEAAVGGAVTGRDDGATPSRSTDIRPETRPVVMIIDKITPGSELIFRERGIEFFERFFVIGGIGLEPMNDGGLPALLDPATGRPSKTVSLAPNTVTRFAVSDGMNPAPGNFVPGLTIQDQFRGPGDASQPLAFNRFNAFRPEETFIGYATPGTARGDTHLMLIAGVANRNPAMRADLEIAGDGRSGASVAAGGVLALGGSLAFSGNVVGSTRVTGTDRGATFLFGNLGSLGTDATGFGDHLFAGNERAPGQIGYFALGESDARLGAPGTPAGVQPGQLQDLGAATPTTGQFGFTRLATNVGAIGLAPGAPLALQGFATGLVEARSGAGPATIFAASTAGLGGVAVTGRNGGREFDATLRLAPTVAGDLPSATRRAAPVPAGERVVTIGDGGTGAVPTTAVASAASFAGVAPGRAAMASVDDVLRRGIAGHADPNTSPLPSSNEHLAWGYFLGDLVNEANGRRENAALGFFVAGRPVDPGTLSTLTGTASYAGGMIGNVAEGGRVRTAVGDFTKSWDFAQRRGTMSARFDNGSYSVPAAMPAGGNVFTGSGVSGDRRMAVQGAFFNSGPVAGAPAAVGGTFGISGSGYGANGVFVGRRQ